MKKSIYIISIFLVLMGCKGEKPEYKINKMDIRFDQPHQVNVLFHVIDKKTRLGVPNLSINDFIVMEDNTQIGSEASATIYPYNKVADISINVKTFLVIDNSKSMENKLDKLKEAAKNLIDISPDFHYYSLYVFSSNLEKLSDFTNNKTLLKKAIDNIKIGTSSTNLYGALKDIGKYAEYYPESHSLNKIKETNIIVFTDGDDTQGSVDFNLAQRALKNKTTFLIGTGQDLKKGILNKMGTFFPLNSIKELKKTFLKIQQKILDQTGSYYWLIYQSPKRGDKQRTLTIKLKENPKVSLSIYFNSKYFAD